MLCACVGKNTLVKIDSLGEGSEVNGLTSFRTRCGLRLKFRDQKGTYFDYSQICFSSIRAKYNQLTPLDADYLNNEGAELWLEFQASNEIKYQNANDEDWMSDLTPVFIHIQFVTPPV
jgi:hypothetical protein